MTLLHEAVRPDCSPKDVGQISEAQIYLADWLKEHFPNLETNVPLKETARTSNDWTRLFAQVNTCKPDETEHKVALDFFRSRLQEHQ